jgi:competence CoiA-like predicted nuclease
MDKDVNRYVKVLEKRLRQIERVAVDHWLPRLRQRIDLLDERIAAVERWCSSKPRALRRTARKRKTP